MKDLSAVLCFGALHYDCIAECIGPYRDKASNPVRTHRTPGGVAHNIARNLAQFGIQTGLSSLVGKDDDGDVLVRQLSVHEIDGKLIRRHKDYASASYIAVLDESGELAVGLADMAIYDAFDRNMLLSMLGEAQGWPNWILDANLPEDTLRCLAENRCNGTLYLAPVSVAKAPRIKPILDRSDVLICNEYEIAILSDQSVKGPAEAIAAARSIKKHPEQIFVVTLGPKGAVLLTGGLSLYFPAPPTDVVDVNGAGDAFFSGFVQAHARGADAVQSVRSGLAKASITAESPNPFNPDFDIQSLELRLEQVSDGAPI